MKWITYGPAIGSFCDTEIQKDLKIAKVLRSLKALSLKASSLETVECFSFGLNF